MHKTKTKKEKNTINPYHGLGFKWSVKRFATLKRKEKKRKGKKGKENGHTIQRKSEILEDWDVCIERFRGFGERQKKKLKRELNLGLEKRPRKQQ